MSSNPGTIRGEPRPSGEIDWEDAAELHKGEDTGGVLGRFRSIRRGPFAELIAFVMNLPEADRQLYAIQKSGDRRFGFDEIRKLHARSDFPG